MLGQIKEKRKQMRTIKGYFGIEELVDKEVYDKYGERAWKFIDETILECLLILREGLDKPITINNWKSGGRFSQRGLRHNMSSLVKNKTRVYLSAHIFGKAVDFDVQGMTSVEVREWINSNADLFPYKIRLERNSKGTPISWVHMDTMSEPKNPRVYMFDV
jgi:hypothetical protein